MTQSQIDSETALAKICEDSRRFVDQKGNRMYLQEAVTALSVGLLASASPCVLPLYPGFLAYLSGGQLATTSRRRYFLGCFVLAGVLVMMLLLGALIALLSISIGAALRWVVPVSDIIIIGLGALLIFNVNPFKALPQIRIPALRRPLANAFAYGLLYGPLTLPCSGPLIVSIFALSLTAGEALSRLSVFLWFGLGFGLPLLILSFLAGGAQRQLTQVLARHTRIINRIAGVMLVGIGLYDLSLNWELISALAPR
jgi:cytochrome c-type biogenesis protein